MLTMPLPWYDFVAGPVQTLIVYACIMYEIDHCTALGLCFVAVPACSAIGCVVLAKDPRDVTLLLYKLGALLLRLSGGCEGCSTDCQALHAPVMPTWR